MTTSLENQPDDPNSDTNKLKFLLSRIELLRSHGLHEEAELLIKKHSSLLKPEIPYRTQELLDTWITDDPEMLERKSGIAKLARHNDTILIEGPTGTGKEILAQALHGDRKPELFFSVNCAGLPSGLVESELFGHVKGAFSGANETRQGIFKAASNGTLLLDEIGELPLETQAKLLRVLQERTVRAVGSYDYIKIDTRIVCATHRDLWKMVVEQKFREDLFFRINTFHFKLTPLRDRIHDIPLILDFVAARYERENHIPVDKKFPRDYIIDSSLLNGNVRSIEQIVARYIRLGILPK